MDETPRSHIPVFCAEYCELENSEETKNTISQVSYKVQWSNTDRIAIVNLTQNKVFEYKVTNAPSIKGTFSPADGVTIQDSDFVPGDFICAVFPYAAASVSGNHLYVTLTNGLSFTSRAVSEAFSNNDIQVSARLAYSSEDMTEPISLDLQRKVAFVSVSSHISEEYLKSESIQSLEIRASGLAGTTEITFNGSNEPVIGNNAGSSDAMLVCPVSKTLSTISESAQFLPVFPASLTSGITFTFVTSSYVIGFHRQGSITALTSEHNNSYPLFSGAYTRVNSEELATSDKTWWIAPKTSDLSDDSDAGAYRDSYLPGSGAGSYGEGSDLADE